MSMYRSVALGDLTCPRCEKRKLPPLEVAECEGGCGTWVSAVAATFVLTTTDVGHNRLARWWRNTKPCPVCRTYMELRGFRDGLLQGCTEHGYFIDADAVPHTGLGEGVDLARLQVRIDGPDGDAAREAVLHAVQAEAVALAKEEAKRAADREKQAKALAGPPDPMAYSSFTSLDPQQRLHRRTAFVEKVVSDLRAGTYERVAIEIALLIDRVYALETLLADVASAGPATPGA